MTREINRRRIDWSYPTFGGKRFPYARLLIHGQISPIFKARSSTNERASPFSGLCSIQPNGNQPMGPKAASIAPSLGLGLGSWNLMVFFKKIQETGCPSGIRIRWARTQKEKLKGNATTEVPNLRHARLENWLLSMTACAGAGNGSRLGSVGTPSVWQLRSCNGNQKFMHGG